LGELTRNRLKQVVSSLLFGFQNKVKKFSFWKQSKKSILSFIFKHASSARKKGFHTENKIKADAAWQTKYYGDIFRRKSTITSTKNVTCNEIYFILHMLLFGF